jgi:hypothetical protein
MAADGKTFAVAVVAVIVIVAAIGVVGLMQTPAAATGTLSIYVKDDPAVWSHVNVTFSQVQVHMASGDNSTDDNSTNDSSGWRTLSMRNGTVDLVALSNISALLASGDIPAGNYTQIRIVVISVTGVMTDNTSVTFTVPSGEQKTTHPFHVVAGAANRLTLEIDLNRSIVQTGQGQWRFTPVLGAVVDGA